MMDRFRRGGTKMKRPRGKGPTTVRASDGADARHLTEFAASRRGVEGFVEPRTAVTDVTIMLVAHDGEWTRRRVPSVEAARSWGNRVGIPVYDVALVGYPKRMREYNERRKAEQKQSASD